MASSSADIRRLKAFTSADRMVASLRLAAGSARGSISRVIPSSVAVVALPGSRSGRNGGVAGAPALCIYFAKRCHEAHAGFGVASCCGTGREYPIPAREWAIGGFHVSL